MVKKLRKKCVLCGGGSPNTFGECLCSYEPILLSGTWEEIAKLIGKQYKTLFNHFIRKS